MIALDGQFCYWDAKSQGDCIFMLANIVVLVSILIYQTYIYVKTRRLQTADFTIYYMLIWIWGLGTASDITADIITLTTGVTYYYLVFKEHPGRQFQAGVMTQYSVMYSMLNVISFFFIQTLLIYLCYKMIKNTMTLLGEINAGISNIDFRNYRFIKRYNLFRILLVVPWIVAPFTGSPSNIDLTNLIRICLFILDSIVCAFIIIYTRRYILSKFERLFDREEGLQYERRFKREMWILLFSCAFRILVYLVIYIIVPVTLKGERNCIEKLSEHLGLTIFNFVAGSAALHYLPVITVIQMYKPDKQDEELFKKNSMLDKSESLLNQKKTDSPGCRKSVKGIYGLHK